MKTPSFAPALFSASLIASAAAHGWVGTLTANGKSYAGPKPVEEIGTGPASAIRQILNTLPVKDLASAELACGRDATPAALTAVAAAGSDVLVDWVSASGNWFHDVGPMMAYLADCGGDCKDFDASGAQWFKIAEQGQDASGNWAQEKLDSGAPATIPLPAALKPGNYLLRHEIVALHTAQAAGGAEFYPSCMQLRVTGSGSGAPKASELVRFPGAYTASAPGVLVDIYNMKTKYQFPGPAIASFVSGSSSGSGSGSSAGNTAAASNTTTKASTSTKSVKAATPTTKAAAASSTKTAKVAAAVSSTKAAAASTSEATCASGSGKRRRHMQRVVRRSSH